MLRLLPILYLLSKQSHAFLDNGIVGTPRVMCAENDLGLDITTKAPFRGNIFVKGRAKDKSCRQSYADGSNNTYSLPLGQCGMQRLRSANPRGIHFSVTVIVSFHPSGFITKNDRAFHVKCFYTEPEEVVTSHMEVNHLPTTEIADDMPMPTCDYSVRRDGPHGPVLSFANVGETVFHVWECKGAEMGMLVKKCAVNDGDGDEHAVINPEGCSTDSGLLSDLTYDINLMRAHATSQVFKYADSNQLYFTCQIRLCQKTMGNCQGVTPPKCGPEEAPSNRTRREAADLLLRNMELDVATRSLLVLDPEDASRLRGQHPGLFCVPSQILPFIPVMLIALIVLSFLVFHIFLRKPKSEKDLN
ncbi:unnamed protein product, partial [Mesorhabditis spiculigera]